MPVPSPLPSPLTPLPFVHILLAVHAGAAFVSHASSALNAHRAAQSAHILKWHLHLGQFDGAVIKATRLIPLRLDSPHSLLSPLHASPCLFSSCLVSPQLVVPHLALPCLASACYDSPWFALVFLILPRLPHLCSPLSTLLSSQFAASDLLPSYSYSSRLVLFRSP